MGTITHSDHKLLKISIGGDAKCGSSTLFYKDLYLKFYEVEKRQTGAELKEQDKSRQPRAKTPRGRQYRKLTRPYTLRPPHPFAQKVVAVTKDDWVKEMREK